MANGAKDKKRRTILEAYYQVIKNTTPGLTVMSRPIAVGREGKECRCKGHISWSMNAYVTIMSKHLVEDCTACSQEHKGWLEKNSRSNQIGENKRQCLPGYVMVSGSSAGSLTPAASFDSKSLSPPPSTTQSPEIIEALRQRIVELEFELATLKCDNNQVLRTG